MRFIYDKTRNVHYQTEEEYNSLIYPRSSAVCNNFIIIVPYHRLVYFKIMGQGYKVVQDSRSVLCKRTEGNAASKLTFYQCVIRKIM